MILLAHDAIFSTRDGVNVLYPFGPGPDWWNNHFPPVGRRPRGETIDDYLRSLVWEMLALNRPGWFSRAREVAIREGIERGEYRYTVWGVQ